MSSPKNMSEFDNSFLQKLTELVPHDYDTVISGTPGFNIKFISGGKSKDPLNIYLNQPFQSSDSITSRNCIYSISPSMQHVFTKRVHKTPFFISYMMADNSELYILDFYIWKPVPVIYRIFYFQFSENCSVLRLALPKSDEIDSNEMPTIGSCYINYHTEGSFDPESNELIINPKGNNDRSSIMVLAYSADQEAIKYLDISEIFNHYHEVEDISRKNHIDCDFEVQDPQIMARLDTLWNNFKLLTPDREPDLHLEDMLGRDHLKRFVIREICNYFGWHHLLERIRFKDSVANKTKKDPEAEKLETLEKYYLNHDKINEIKLSAMLQNWWDRYSLPLYQLKFNSILRHSPEQVFMIFSLAQWLGLPWSKLLLDKCHQFELISDLEILTCFYQLVQLRRSQKNVLSVKSGPAHPGNFVRLKRGDLTIRYTRYGKKAYSSLYLDTNLIVKMDKEVCLKFDEIKHKVEVHPDIVGYTEELLHVNILMIKSDNFEFQVPLLWSKGELQNNTFRLRWIFKKNRYQYSCAKKKKDSILEINKQKIEFAQSQWGKVYQPIKPNKPGMGLMIFDRDGRSYFLANMRPQECQVVGWVQNHNGVLADTCNLQTENGRHWVLPGSESGHIETSVMLANRIRAIMVNIKHYSALIELRYWENPQLAKVLLYSPSQSKGHLIALVDEEILHKRDKIRSLFRKSLGFLPVILPRARTKIIKSGNPVVFIQSLNKDQVDLKNKTNKGISLYSITYSERLEEVFTDILPI